MSTRQLAAYLAGLSAGDHRLSANVLQNLEAGRRQQAVTVDELLLLAAGLAVPPEFFLAPPDGEHVQVAPDRVVGPREFLEWVRGRQPLPGTDDPDSEHYQAASTEVLGDLQLSGNAALKADFLRHAAGMLDDFFADNDDILRRTRDQVRGLLDDLESTIRSGADADQILARITEYRNRLPSD